MQYTENKIHVLPGNGVHPNNVYRETTDGLYSNGDGITLALDHKPHVPCIREGIHKGIECIRDAHPEFEG